MDDLLIRRREMAETSGGGGGGGAPLYDLSGTYITSNPNGTLIISDYSHWHYTKTQNGTLKFPVFGYPDTEFLNKTITFKAVISNLNVISGSVSGKKIRLGNEGSAQIIDLADLGDGDGTYEQTYTFTYSYQNKINLYLTESWSVPWEVEFDLKLYADDVWIS